jgi:hypothetical protein|tara:strand:- start:5782 stop:6513 length:732 start_codon:yes stop_codon:yes gene_type:complete
MANIQKTKSTELSKIDFAADAGIGLEKMNARDLAIPFYVLLQKTSPQVEDIEVAKPGMIFNTVTNEIFDSLKVIPCGYKRCLVEWVPRDKGGGYVGVHETNSELANRPRNDRGEIELDNGNILVETSYHFILAGDRLETSVISMTSTQLKKSRRWNSLQFGLKVPSGNGEMVTPASFSHIYKLSSVAEKNDKGSWHGWNIEIAGPIKDTHVYQVAKTFAGTVRSGEVQVTPPAREEAKENKDF